MEIFQIIILSIIQGITEFLPISSSGHLSITPYIFNWEIQPLSFDIAIHAGTLLAILIYYRKYLINLITKILHKEKDAIKILMNLIIGTIPIVIIGLSLKDQIEHISSHILLIAFNLIIFGIIFIFSDILTKNNKKSIKNLNIKNSLLVGIFQSIAFLRGTSRSGITIIGGLTQGLKKKEAADFAFLLGIPAIAGAVFIQLLNFDEIIHSNIAIQHYIVGIITSSITGFFAIKYGIKLIQKFGLKYFGLYRIFIGIILLLIYWSY